MLTVEKTPGYCILVCVSEDTRTERDRTLRTVAHAETAPVSYTGKAPLFSMCLCAEMHNYIKYLHK